MLTRHDVPLHYSSEAILSMKSKEVVERRLRTLRIRYLKQFVASSQDRLHRNCLYNREHKPTGQYKSSKSVDVDVASRKNVTLVVIQPDPPSIRLCMYGSEDSTKWNGDICDDDVKSQHCPLFRPIMSVEEARLEFQTRLANDDYTYDNYRDIATLQWVLEDRIHKHQLSLWERFIVWIRFRRIKAPAPLPLLPAGDVPDDFWVDNVDPTSNP
jgi:hypothetical protein